MKKMNEKEKEEIRELISAFRSLDPLSRVLIQNSATTLLVREQMEKRKEIQVQQ